MRTPYKFLTCRCSAYSVTSFLVFLYAYACVCLIILQINRFSSRPKTEDAWIFAKPNAIQAVGVMSFGEYMVSKVLSQCGVFCTMKKCFASYLCLESRCLKF